MSSRTITEHAGYQVDLVAAGIRIMSIASINPRIRAVGASVTSRARWSRTYSAIGLVWIVFAVALGGLPSLAAAQAGTSVEYYHLDAVGSVRAVTDQAGNVVRRHDYFPFGEGDGTTTGQDAVRFAGKERDAESGLDYFGARYYASRTGRFTTVDPQMGTELALVDPQRWNRYAYSLNNPLRYTDPDGRSPKLAILAFKVGHALYKGYDVYSTVEGVVDAGGTLIKADATPGERGWAGLQLAGELSGVTDLFKAGRGVLNAIDDAGRAYHHTFEQVVDSIKRTGLQKGTFATPVGGLSPLQAQLELALDPKRGMRNVVLQIDLGGLRAAGYKVPEAKRVRGWFGMPGGGWEMAFDYEVPPEFIKVIDR
jgi:RHS repeat-associated protein